MRTELSQGRVHAMAHKRGHHPSSRSDGSKRDRLLAATAGKPEAGNARSLLLGPLVLRPGSGPQAGHPRLRALPLGSRARHHKAGAGAGAAGNATAIGTARTLKVDHQPAGAAGRGTVEPRLGQRPAKRFFPQLCPWFVSEIPAPQTQGRQGGIMAISPPRRP